MKQRLYPPAESRDRQKVVLRWLVLPWAVGAFLLALAAGTHAWAAEPAVNLSVHDLNFPPQAQGTPSAMQVMVVTDSGGAELSITELSIAGENKSDFTQNNNCPASPSALPALAHCEIRVTFSPTVTGTLVAVLSISDNASGSPHTVNLKGISTPPVALPVLGPANLVFGNLGVGTSSAAKVIIFTNTGSATLNVNSDFSITGPNSGDFRVQALKSGCPSGTWQLAPKTSCEFGVVFAPTSIGAKNAQISVSDDAPGSPRSVALSGTGIGLAPTTPKN